MDNGIGLAEEIECKPNRYEPAGACRIGQGMQKAFEESPAFDTQGQTCY